MADIGLRLKYEERNPNHLQALKGNEGIQHSILNKIFSNKLRADGWVKGLWNVPLLYRLPNCPAPPASPNVPHTRFEYEINEPGPPRRVFVVAASERTNDLAKALSPSLHFMFLKLREKVRVPRYFGRMRMKCIAGA